MNRKPLVGLVADRKMLGHHPFHCVGEKYIDAVVSGSDCFALLVPALAGRLETRQLLDTVDGLLFTGSVSMVNPALYNGPDLPEGQHLDEHRDNTTLPLMQQAIARGIPVFGICRGFQEMNVVHGGSLLQKVHETPGMMDHREASDESVEVQYGPSHPVKFVEGGLIQRLTGFSEYTVNSIHNQGVERLGDGLIAEAVAPDGLVEAFRVGHAPGFTLAVQWHPEWKYAGNALSVNLFKAFGDACRQYQSQRGQA